MTEEQTTEQTEEVRVLGSVINLAVQDMLIARGEII